MTLKSEIPVTPTIPPTIVKELVEDATITNHLGDHIKGEPLLPVPGTRAANALHKLNIEIVEKE